LRIFFQPLLNSTVNTNSINIGHPSLHLKMAK
jgi:hypothetical protein